VKFGDQLDALGRREAGNQAREAALRAKLLLKRAVSFSKNAEHARIADPQALYDIIG
jgi:hypothetical protein